MIANRSPLSPAARIPAWQWLWLLFPLALLAVGLEGVFYPSADAAYTDVAITHYPNAIFLLRALREWWQIPFWSPTILSGYPFAANPLSGLWYPPGWLALLLPLPLGLNLLAALHLAWGGLGTYRLLRSEGLSHGAAVLGGAAFAILPKLFAHFGAGHLTLVYAVSWTPWLLYSVAEAKLMVEDGYSKDSAFHISSTTLKPGIILALIFLADVRWAVYAGLFWLGYWAAGYRFKVQGEARPSTINLKPVTGFLASVLLNVGIAALLAAPLALPLLEYTRLSTRAGLQGADYAEFTLPVARLLGLAFPDFGGFHEFMLYPGILALSLALIGWIAGTGSRRFFWAAAAVLSLLLSLGVGAPLLSRLPGFDLLRVPSRALFITGLSLAALAAHGAQSLLGTIHARARKRAGLALAGLAAFTLAFSAILLVATGGKALNAAWVALGVLAALLLIHLRMSGRLAANTWLALALAVCLLDWSVMDISLRSPKPRREVLSEGDTPARFLSAQEGRFRVYSPSYSLPQQTAARFHLELADGVDPMQLTAYRDYMETATGVPSGGYSVTLPPFDGEVQDANIAYQPDARRLGLLNVRFVVASFDLPVEGLELVTQFGDQRVYENRYALPRAWTQPAESAPGEQAAAAALVSWTPNDIVVEGGGAASGEQLLVLSELAYPGWEVQVDGRRAEIETVAGLLRGVRMDAGFHHVKFRYRPTSLFTGFGLCAAGLLLLLMFHFIRLLAGETLEPERQSTHA